MKSVKIRKNNKNEVRDYSDGTFNDTIMKLIDDVENKMPLVNIDYSPVSSMRLDDEVVERLESFKLTDGESYENILIRMLLVAQTLNTTNNNI